LFFDIARKGGLKIDQKPPVQWEACLPERLVLRGQH
jgi:hypothetical protein